MVGENTRRVIPLVSATLTIVGTVIAYKLTQSLDRSQSWGIVLAWMAAGIIVTYLVARVQARSQEESPEAIKERVSELESELRKQVQIRSYAARRDLIEDPLEELGLDIEPRVGWVRDPRLVKPISEKLADVVAAFDSSERRLLIVGEPGAGKTMSAYFLIEHLDETEGDQRIPLLVNLSAWEAQDDFEAFLVDYLCSSVGYQVRQRAVASAFVKSRRYSLVLDGLDEIPAGLRKYFSERLDEFVRGLPSEIAVVVTCRTQEYEELRSDYPTGLGLVQAVEILLLTSQQLDRAFVELAKRDKEWEAFLSQRHLIAYQRVRDLLSNPLFLNLAVVGRLSPAQLLDWTTTEQELRDLVLDRYLGRTLADQRQYEPADARRYLTWIARFLNGDELSPFGLKETDFTVFDLADLTPPDPPRRYRLFGVLLMGLGLGLGLGLIGGLVWSLIFGLGLALLTGWPFKRSAVSSRLILVWPSTKRRLIDFLRRAGKGLMFGLGVWLPLVLVLGLTIGLAGYGWGYGLFVALAFWLYLGLPVALPLALVFGLLRTKSVLITSRTPKEASSRSLIAALTWLASGLVVGLGLGLTAWNVRWLVVAMVVGLGLGLILALRNGGWFVLLQKVAHRRLARAGNFPPRPYEFLEWGIEKQIFRRVGGGVRFRHNLIQQHLVSTSD